MAKPKNWQQQDIVVKFAHLNPAVQQIVGFGWKDLLSHGYSIREARKFRALFEASMVVDATAASIHFREKSFSDSTEAGSLAVIAAGARALAAKVIQKTHIALVQKMKQTGILQTQYEPEYPSGWINPTNVEKTHPVIHVKANGDIVFHRPTRWEYARMRFQEKWPGKMGLQPWRWRAYLQKPKAPQPIRKWAEQTIQKWAGSLVPRPALSPVPVQARQTKPHRRLPVRRTIRK